jgi:hypothetical protein
MVKCKLYAQGCHLHTAFFRTGVLFVNMANSVPVPAGSQASSSFSLTVNCDGRFIHKNMWYLELVLVYPTESIWDVVTQGTHGEMRRRQITT